MDNKKKTGGGIREAVKGIVMHILEKIEFMTNKESFLRIGVGLLIVAVGIFVFTVFVNERLKDKAFERLISAFGYLAIIGLIMCALSAFLPQKGTGQYDIGTPHCSTCGEQIETKDNFYAVCGAENDKGAII